MRLTNIRTITVAATTVLICTLAKSALCDNSPTMTQAEAVNRAIRFCNSIGAGQSTPDQTTAQYPVDDNAMGRLKPINWQGRWRVVFKSGMEVEISDRTGVVTKFIDIARLNEMGRHTTGSAEQLSKDAAIARATTALNASGTNDEIGQPTAQFCGGHGPNYWLITWPREIQGTIFRNQYISASIDATAGDINGFVIMFPSVPPLPKYNSGPSLSKDKAVQLAWAYAQDNGIPAGNLLDVKLQFVSLQESLGPATTSNTPSPTVLAWICVFKNDMKSTEIRVDAVTGTVIAATH